MRKIIFLLSFLTIGALIAESTINAQSYTSVKSSDDFKSINGIIKDRKTDKVLQYVNVSVPGTGIGTVSNSEGLFVLKINDSLDAKFIQFSHLGYKTLKVGIDKIRESQQIYLVPDPNLLEEIIIYPNDATSIVEKAISRIKYNYSAQEQLLSSFYRESVKKSRSYITVSEAVADIYKTPYSEGINRDQVQILKGRQLLSPDSKDTLMVKLLGGPTLSLVLDLVKNGDILLDYNSLKNYKFELEESVMIDNRLHYTVNFYPNVTLEYALFKGKLYIDKENFNISRAEFNLDMDDKNKATDAILKKKPFGLHFKPEQVSFLVSYKNEDKISTLHYVRSEVKFKCDWKKRLFHTNYTIVSESVITGIRSGSFIKVPYKQSFKDTQSLSDRVQSFNDPQFWEAYNIIAPEESLEIAVNKLKKKNSK